MQARRPLVLTLRGMRRGPSGVGRLSIGFIAVAGMLCGCPRAASAADDQKRVLVLYSTSQDAQFAVIGERDLPPILSRGLSTKPDYYSEYFDTGRFSDAAYLPAFSDYLKSKYGGRQLDVVIAIQDVAVDFLNRYRDELFPETPIVYYTYADDGSAHRMRNSTGVVSERDLHSTIDLALRLQPDITQVFVVTGNSDRDRAYEQLARKQLQSFDPRLSFTYLSGLATNELVSRLATLPPQSIVYYVVTYEDGEGEIVNPLEYLDRLALVANRPIYSWVDPTLDHGVVGGAVSVLGPRIELVGHLALRVLHGEATDRIPVVTAKLLEYQADWRQIERWGIDESRLPAGTRLLFREPTPWNRYRFFILGAAGVLLAQTWLIAALLVHRTRLRRADARIRHSQAELHENYERLRDLGHRLLVAQDAERSHIARELHDDISQQMALLSIDLELLVGLGPGQEEEAGQIAADAFERVQHLVKSVHSLSHRLHPETLRIVGLVPAIARLQRDFSDRLDITFVHDEVLPPVPQDTNVCFFRIAQEALQNAAAHSKAQHVWVRLISDAAGFSLAISDDGEGFDVNAAWGRGLGLISMRERVEALGGTLTIESSRESGTRIEANVPLTISAQVTRQVAEGVG
jgi:signal transduction histidine kinase